jgi:hypothetical protein
LADLVNPQSEGTQGASGTTKPISREQVERNTYGGMTSRQLFGGEKDWVGTLGIYDGPYGDSGSDDRTPNYQAPIQQVVMHAGTVEERLQYRFNIAPVNIGSGSSSSTPQPTFGERVLSTLADEAVGFGKGIVNVVPETLATVYRGWGYIGAQTVIRGGEAMGIFAPGSTDKSMAFYSNINGRVLKYDNGIQEVSGLVGGLIGPSAPLRALAVAEDLAMTRIATSTRGSYSSTFITNGLDTANNPNLLKSPEAIALGRELSNGNMPASMVPGKVEQILNSGVELPTMREAATGEFFYKVEPMNSNSKYPSVYWMNSSQYANIAGRNAAEIGDILGLPASSAANGSIAGWRVSQTTPLVGIRPTIFESQIAPAAQGVWEANGLGHQTIIANPNLFYAPRPVAEIPAIVH